MDYHIQPYSPTYLGALRAFITAYRQAFPDAKLLPAEYYASHLALDGGQQLWCAFDGAQHIVGFAPLFATSVPSEHARDELRRIWTVILADPSLPAAKLIHEALLQKVLTHAQQLAASFPAQPTCLSADLMASQQPDIQHLLDSGFRVFAIVDVLERATATSIMLPALPAGLTLATTKLTTPAEHQPYLAAYNQCFPDRSKTLTELHFFLTSPVWHTGIAVVAHDQQQLIGSVLVYADSQPRCAIIDDVFVLPEWRGQGVARHLLSTCLGYCDAHGIDRVRLEVKRENIAAQRLYRAVGFAPINTELLLERTLD